MIGREPAAIGQLRQQAHHSARKASPWLVGFGRLGHLAEGAVYALIGVLAVQVALGRGGATTDNKGALTQIAAAPFGRLLLIAVTIGILGFALWRFLQAILDTDNVGTDAKGLFKRLGKAGSGAAHIVLALSAVRLLRTGNAGASSSASAQDWTARLLSEPFGRWLIGLIGLAVIGVGCYQIYKRLCEKGGDVVSSWRKRGCDEPTSLSDRSDRRAVACAGTAAAPGEAGRSPADNGHARTPECDLLPPAYRRHLAHATT